VRPPRAPALACFVLATGVASAEPPARAAVDLEAPGVPVAKVDVVDGQVDHADRRGWKRVVAGFRLRTGERLRTGADSLARIDFPFMTILIGANSTFSIPPSIVLSTSLEDGRLEQVAEGGEAIKLRTPEAEVRGGGRVIVRRENGTTAVSVVTGRFRVIAGGTALALNGGQGTLVAGGRGPTDAVALPPAPIGLTPGTDPVYVIKGQPVSFSWSPAGAAHHVQLLGLGTDEVVMTRDTGASPASLAVPWLGTYRWRVATRDPRGFEGLPSPEGLICVVEK
jgi:hypothetical protein